MITRATGVPSCHDPGQAQVRLLSLLPFVFTDIVGAFGRGVLVDVDTGSTNSSGSHGWPFLTGVTE